MCWLSYHHLNPLLLGDEYLAASQVTCCAGVCHRFTDPAAAPTAAAAVDQLDLAVLMHL